MSDFRLFSIVTFFAGGALCALANRAPTLFDDRWGPFALAGVIGFLAVGLFGRRTA